MPPSLRVPRWLPVALTTLLGGAGALGAFVAPQEGLAGRLANGVLYAAVTVYGAIALLDGIEHFRLEKHVTGRYFSWVVIPFSESIVHVVVIATLIGFLLLARPIGAGIDVRDAIVLGAPLLFTAFGWCDELVFHRRRALHREDILHTLSHLTAGVLLASVFAARMLDWSGIR